MYFILNVFVMNVIVSSSLIQSNSPMPLVAVCNSVTRPVAHFYLLILSIYVYLNAQAIMRDRWINMGFEDKELKPFKEASKDELDTSRIGNVVWSYMS